MAPAGWVSTALYFVSPLRLGFGLGLAIRVRCDRFISEYAAKPAMARRQEFQGFRSAVCRLWGQRAYM